MFESSFFETLFVICVAFLVTGFVLRRLCQTSFLSLFFDAAADVQGETPSKFDHDPLGTYVTRERKDTILTAVDEIKHVINEEFNNISRINTPKVMATSEVNFVVDRDRGQRQRYLLLGFKREKVDVHAAGDSQKSYPSVGPSAKNSETEYSDYIQRQFLIERGELAQHSYAGPNTKSEDDIVNRPSEQELENIPDDRFGRYTH